MDIKIHRNNSGVAKLTLKKKEDGTEWDVPTGNELQFSVKKSFTDSDEEIIFFKTATGDGGNEYEFFITGFDTDIMPGTYKWDLKDKTANLTLDLGDFKILENVYQGQAVTGEENELTEIECFVEVDGIYTESDYNNLNNRPKINNVTLEDNKTGADLGLADLTVTDALGERVSENEEDIAVLGVEMDTKADRTELPEKLSDLTNDEGFISEAVIDSKDTTTLNSAKTYTDAEIADIDIPTKTSDLTNDSGFITSAYHDSTKADASTVSAIDTRLTEAEGDIESLESGKVDTATFETAINNVYTKAETTAAIASAVEDIVSFDCQVVETLPASGVKGTIYLTEKTTTETGDIYNEYLWIVPTGGTGVWEKIGNTAVDISGKLDKVTTTATYDRAYAVKSDGSNVMLSLIHI